MGGDNSKEATDNSSSSDVSEPRINEIPEPRINEIPEPRINEIPEPRINEIPEPRINEIPEPRAEPKSQSLADYFGFTEEQKESLRPTNADMMGCMTEAMVSLNPMPGGEIAEVIHEIKEAKEERESEERHQAYDAYQEERREYERQQAHETTERIIEELKTRDATDIIADLRATEIWHQEIQNEI
jgi:hypothetical protein